MKISARDIQLLVAGALALTGFRALIWLPYYFTVSLDSVRIIAGVVTGVALPIGIGILQSRTWAILAAQIYLWLVILSACVTVPIFCHFVPAKAGRMLWSSVPELLVSIILLALIYWSRSRRFHPPNTALEPTGTGPVSSTSL